MSNGIGGLGGGLLNYARNLQGSGETNEEKRARLLEKIQIKKHPQKENLLVTRF